jgi:hypothetical protein
MKRSNKIGLTIGTALIVFGILMAALPKQWIEETLGFEPDGGNGMLELALAVVPLAIGATMVVSVFLATRRVRAGERRSV